MYPFIKVFALNIPTYGLCACVAFLICALLAFKKAKICNIDFNDLLILFAVSIGCGIFSGYLLYIVVTYGFETICKLILSGDFSFFKNQGIVFYGGLIGGLIGGVVTARVLKIKIESLEVCIVPYIPLGHAIGRVGCLLAGCCYGFSYNGRFAVSTIFDGGQGTYFPIQAVEALCNLIILAVLFGFIRKKRKKFTILCLYLIMYSCLRFFLEFFRGDSIRGSFLAFSTSQWISLLIILFCLVMWLAAINKEKAKS